VEHLGFLISIDDGHALIKVRGDIDANTSADLCEAITLAQQCADRDVMVDLAGVTFMDSSGIATLIRAQRSLALVDRCLRIRNAQGTVERVLSMTGATECLLSELPPPAVGA
jgi:anti-sigma B factor antagonist